MANDANGIGGGPPRKPGLPPPQNARTRPSPGARDRRPAASAAPTPRGQAAAKRVPDAGRRAAEAGPGKPPAAGRPLPRAESASGAAPGQAKAQAFAAERARDGVDADADAARSARTAADSRDRKVGEEANLRRVAQDPTLDPLVLPPPQAAPIGPQQTASLLARLNALSGPAAAAQATDGRVAPEDGLVTPAMLRYAKNELGLSPKALRMLAGLSAGVGGTGAARAAADDDASTPPPPYAPADVPPYASAEANAGGDAHGQPAEPNAGGSADVPPPGFYAGGSADAPPAYAAADPTTGAPPTAVPRQSAPAAAPSTVEVAAAPLQVAPIAPQLNVQSTVGGGGGAAAAAGGPIQVVRPSQPQARTPIDAPPATVQVTTVDGAKVAFDNSNPYDLKYHGHMNWAVFQRLVTHDQLEAVFSLMLLRQIDIGWQNYVQNRANELDLLSATMQVELSRVQAQLSLAGSVLDLKASFDQGPSKLLRNLSANKTRTEDELNMKLETNNQGSQLRNKMVDLADGLRTKQTQARGPIDRRDEFGGDVLDFVPAVAGDPAAPERRLPRGVLSSHEEKGFSGPEAEKYKELAKELEHESSMDASLRYGRLSHEATLMEQARDQTRRASAAEAARNNPELAARYNKLAAAYDARAKDLRGRAEHSGYLGAVPSATRTNRRQFKDAIDGELRDVNRLQTQLDSIAKQLQNQGLTAERRQQLEREQRHCEIGLEDRQFRLGGMHAAVATVEAAQGTSALGPTVSGTKAVVQRVRALLDGLRGERVGSAPHVQAQGAFDAFMRTVHPNAARSALLSEDFRRGTEPQLRAASGPMHEGAPEPVRAAGAGLEAQGTTPEAARGHAQIIDDWLRVQAASGAAGAATYRPGVPAEVQSALGALRGPGLDPAGRVQHAATVGNWLRQSIPAEVLAAKAALGQGNLPTAAARGHAATIDAWLRADRPGYAERIGRSNRARMDRHTEQRQLWDRENAATLPAERSFWRNNANLPGPPLQEAGRVRQLIDRLYPRRSNALMPGAPHFDGVAGTDPVLGPLRRFTGGLPPAQGGANLLDADARRAHLASLAGDARAWSEGRHDAVFDFMAGAGQKYLQVAQSAADQMAHNLTGMAEDAGAAVASSIDEDRDAFYAALNNERGDTLGMVHQLMSVLRVG